MKIINVKNREEHRQHIWEYEYEKGKRALYEGNIANGSDTTFHKAVRVVQYDNHLTILTDEGEGRFVEHSITFIGK